MGMTDPIADMLTRIRNASRARHQKVAVPWSRLKENIVKILIEEGYLKDHKKVKAAIGGGDELIIQLKFDRESRPIITGMKRVSTPGRGFTSAPAISPIRKGLGLTFCRRPKGFLSIAKRKERKSAASSFARSGSLTRGVKCRVSENCPSQSPRRKGRRRHQRRSFGRPQGKTANLDSRRRRRQGGRQPGSRRAPNDDRKIRALHGLTRKLIANMAQGVSHGFTRVLDINGVGYRAEVKGQEIHMTLGYSHPVVFRCRRCVGSGGATGHYYAE